ncbi:MAG: AI-2E family transporter [Thermoanaerobaculia bacterium]
MNGSMLPPAVLSGENAGAGSGSAAGNGGPVRSGRSTSWILLAVITSVGAVLCWKILQPFANVILWSVVLAMMFSPMYSRLLLRTRRPNLAAALTLSVAVISVLLPVGVASLAVAGEIGDLVDEAPAKWDAWFVHPLPGSSAQRWRADLEARFPAVARLDPARIQSRLSELGETVVKQSAGIAGRLLKASVEFVLILFCLFYLLRDGALFEKVLRDFLPLSLRESEVLIHRTVEVVRASVYGVIAMAFLQGAIGGVMFAILGLPSPVLWGVVMSFFAMIPMIGAGAIWVPAGLFLLVSDHAGKGIALLLVGTFIISTVDNLLRPRLVGGKTGLHELVVLFAVLGGLEVFGLVGLLVGPAVFAIAWSLLELFRASDRREDPADPKLTGIALS